MGCLYRRTDRKQIKGIAYIDGTGIIATQAASTVKDLDAIQSDWTLLDWAS